MSRKGSHLKIALAVGFMAALLLALSSIEASAQCAMCRSAVSNSTNAAKLARSLNFATLILLIPPVTIFCAFFFVAFRRTKRVRAAGHEAGVAEAGGKQTSEGLPLFGRRGRTKPDSPSTLASPNRS